MEIDGGKDASHRSLRKVFTFGQVGPIVESSAACAVGLDPNVELLGRENVNTLWSIIRRRWALTYPKLPLLVDIPPDGNIHITSYSAKGGRM